MQKKIIALAIAGLVSGAAYAQTNVTLYGSVDIGYAYAKSDYKKFSGIEDGTMGASQLGFRGEENLGNGLKAVFDANFRIRGDEGTLAFRNGDKDARWVYVGLAGNFGTVTAGRVRSPSDEWRGLSSSMGWTGLTPANTLMGQLSNSVLAGIRWDNSIKYVSPNFSGLDFMAVYSFGERVSGNRHYNGSAVDGYGVNCRNTPSGQANNQCHSADTTDAGRLGLGLRYVNGPVSLVAVYEAQADDDSAKPYNNANVDNQGFGAKGWMIGGAYDFNVVKVYASYNRVKANHNGRAYDETDGGSDKQTLWTLGLSAPVSAAGNVWFEYAQYKDRLNDGLRAQYTLSDADVMALGPNFFNRSGHKSKGYSLGYTHTLSKRTSLHAFVTRFDVDRGINNAVGSPARTAIGEDQTVFALGMRHSF
jgi:predicted porin